MTTAPRPEPFTYFSDAVYRDEQEAIFASGWVCAGRADQLDGPGAVRPFDLAGEPLMLVRNGDGAVAALSRLCLHRWHELIDEPTNLSALVCPYHRWTYDLTGALRGVPMSTTEERDRLVGTCLPRFAVEEWNGFVFVNLRADAPPLGPQLDEVSELLAPYDLAGWRTVASIDHGMHAVNWKLAVENAVENYHHIGTHRDTLEKVAPARLYRVEPRSSPLTTVLRMPYVSDGDSRPRDRGLPPASGLSGEALSEGVVVAVYPTLLFSVSAELAFWFEGTPIDADHTHIRLHLVVPPTTADDPVCADRFAPILDSIREIQHEDDAVYKALVAARSSRVLADTPLLDIEDGVRQFHEYYALAMSGALP